MSAGEDQMRVGIIGLGPVGSTLAVHLAEAGATVVICDIDQEKLSLIQAEGITLHNTIEKHHTFELFCNDVKNLAEHGLDLVVISVKTPNLPVIIDLLAASDDGKLRVMCAQNGIDNEQIAAAAFGEARTLRMVINYAGAMTAANRVNVTFFNPPNYVSALDTHSETMARRFADRLNSAAMETVIPQNIQDHVWEKAILNSSLSAVCAITNRTMQEVMEFPPTLEIVKAIIDESVGIARAEGIRLEPNFRDHCLVYLNKGGPHRPTMLVDLDNGLPTEIECLNGKIVEYGRRHSIAAPWNSSITNLIRMLQRKPGKLHA